MAKGKKKDGGQQDKAKKSAGGGGGLLLLVIGLFALGYADPPSGSTTTPSLTAVASSDALPCAAYSYGQVRQFFLAHECVRLHRVLFQSRDVDGKTMLVAVSLVGMPNSSDAAGLKQLDDRSGTGNVTELSQGGVRFTGMHYVSGVNGDTVTVAEAEPLSGQPSAAMLLAAAQAGLAAEQR